MANGASKPSPTSPAGVDRQPVEYDDYIEQKIQKTRQHLHAVELSVALLVLAVGSLAYLATMVLVDHWVIPHGLGFGSRLAALLVLVVAAGGYALVVVAPLLVRRVNPLYAARAIEQSRPALKNSLINLLLLRARSAELPPVVFEGMRHQAANDLTKVTVESAVDGSRLVKLGYVLATLVVAFCLYKVLSPKDPLRSIGRVIDPWAELAVPTRVQIDDVQPGDSQQLQEKRVRVSALVEGLESGEPVTIYYTTADGQLVDQPVRMELPEDSYRYAAELPEGGSGLQQDLTYRITAGDAISPVYHVQALTAPAISVERVEYSYPAYTELPPRTTERQGDLQAIEGTNVTLHAKATHPIKSASVRFDEGGSAISMSSKGREASVNFGLRLEKGKPEHSTYNLVFSDQQGHGPEDITPIRYRIEVVADLPPEVAFVQPQQLDPKVELTLAEAGSVRLALAASDPDFKLASVTLMLERDGSMLPDQPLLAEPRGGPFRTAYVLNARSLGLKPGDKLVFWAVAKDNKQPDPNRVETPKYTLRIVTPEQQKKQQDQLAQAKPPAGQKPNEPPPEAGQNGEAGQRPQGQPPEDGDKGEQKQQPPDGKQEGDGQKGDKQQGDANQGVDPDADPGKAIEEINEHFNKEDQPPKQNDQNPKQDPGEQGGNEQPEQKKQNNPNQEESPSGQGAKSSARSQKPGESGKAQSPEGKSGENGQAGEGGTGRSHGEQPEKGQKNPADQKQDKPGEQGGEQDKPLGGQRTGEKTAADSGAGGKPGQPDDQSGGQQTPGQNQPGMQQNGTPDGQQPDGQKQPAGQQQPGQQAGGQQKPDGQQNGQQGGQQQPAGQQPSGQQGAQQENGKQSGGQQGQPGEKAQPGQQPSGGQQQKPGAQQQGGQQPQGQQPGEQQHGQQQSGAQPKGGQQQPGQQQGGQQKPRQQDQGQQNPGQQNQGQQAAGGNQQQPGGKMGQKPGDEAAGNKPAGSNEQAGKQPGDQGGKQPGEKPDSNKQQDGGKPAGGQPGQGDKAAGQPGDQPAADKQANPQASGQPDAKGGDPEEGKEKSGAGQSAGDKQGTPSPQESNQSRDKKQGGQDGNQQQPMNSGEGSSPSRSPKESDSKGSVGGDQSGGGEDGGGQKANQSGTGGAGQNTASDEGAGKSKEKGPGETSGKSGDQAQADKPTPGKSGQKPGQGSAQQPGDSKPGGQQAGGGKDQQGQPSEQPPSGNPTATAEGGGKLQGANNRGGGGASDQNVGGKPPQQQSTAGPEEEPNLDYARKATDLALDRLKHELQKPGADELLDKLKWTRADAQRFIERWEVMKQAAQQPGEAGQKAQAQLDDSLRGLGLRPHGTTASGDHYRNQRLRNLRETTRTRPPAEYADQYRAYSTGTSQARSAEGQK